MITSLPLRPRDLLALPALAELTGIDLGSTLS
jgi:hypothetical protein